MWSKYHWSGTKVSNWKIKVQTLQNVLLHYYEIQWSGIKATHSNAKNNSSVQVLIFTCSCTKIFSVL